MSHDRWAFGNNETLRTPIPSPPAVFHTIITSQPGCSLAKLRSFAHIDHVGTCAAVPLCCFRVMPFHPLPSSTPSSPVACSVKPVPAIVSASFVFPPSSELTASRALTGPHCLFTSVSLGNWKLHPILPGSAVPISEQVSAFNRVLQTS